MNPSFREVITAADGDRLDLFLSAATRMGTAGQNIEKDIDMERGLIYRITYFNLCIPRATFW